MEFEVGKYYYNNLHLIKVTAVDGKNITLRGYDDSYSADLLELMGYYLLPVDDPEGTESLSLKLRQ